MTIPSATHPLEPDAGSFTLDGVGQTINFSNARCVHGQPVRRQRYRHDLRTAANDVVDGQRRYEPDRAGRQRPRPSTCRPAQIEKVGIATLQGNDTINVNIHDTVNAFLFVDGGEPTTVNKGNDILNLFDCRPGKKGTYSNISAWLDPGAGAVVLSFKTTGNVTRVDYLGIEKQTRR